MRRGASSTLNIAFVLGARPQIIKSSPVIYAAEESKGIRLEIIHTGQHYDYKMSKKFFEELELPDPKFNLGVGSGTHAWQTGQMMIRLEEVLLRRIPDVVVVPGDTNSTLASALAAAKLQIPVVHIEAGARSFDMKMPEEINRKLTDHVSSQLFAPSENCARNLMAENIPAKKIVISGDTMREALDRQLPRLEQSRVLDKFDLQTESYGVLTVHRAENTVDYSKLETIFDALGQCADMKFVFPVHPRTLRSAKKILSKSPRNVELTDPLGYLDMLRLVRDAEVVLTDSGGLQKEAFWMGTPCLVLRESTEWIELIENRANHLVGTYTKAIISKIREIQRTKDIKKALRRLKDPYRKKGTTQLILRNLKKVGEASS